MDVPNPTISISVPNGVSPDASVSTWSRRYRRCRRGAPRAAQSDRSKSNWNEIKFNDDRTGTNKWGPKSYVKVRLGPWRFVDLFGLLLRLTREELPVAGLVDLHQTQRDNNQSWGCTIGPNNERRPHGSQLVPALPLRCSSSTSAPTSAVVFSLTATSQVSRPKLFHAQ